jgi:TDG/mug DNA glycosylase family protein
MRNSLPARRATGRARKVSPPRPDAAALRAARNKRVPDVIASHLKILFVGINPGLYSGATGHHFARPGNRFWPALAASGLTPKQLFPYDERELLRYGLGITNVVNRATASAAELSQKELIAGGRRLVAKLRRYRPGIVAVLGIQAYKGAFGQQRVAIGRQLEPLGGCALWVLPNPSGLNANYQREDFARLFRQVRHAVSDGKARWSRRGSGRRRSG